MYKKMIIAIIGVLAIFNLNVSAKTLNYRYIIVGDSENQQLIYETKNDLLYSFQQITLGVDERYYDQVLKDYTETLNNYTYQNGLLTIVLGDGLGKKLEGELKLNYCESDESINTRVFLFEIFN